LPIFHGKVKGADHVNSGNGEHWIHDYSLAAFRYSDKELSLPILFCDQGRDIRLEETGSETHDDQSKDKTRKRAVWILDNTWYGSDNEEDVSNKSNGHRDADRVVAAQLGIGDVSS